MGQHRSVLRNVSIFAGVPDSAIESLESALVTKKSPRDSVIVSQEDEGDALYIISEGRVKVVLTSNDTGREMILSIFKSGDFFGEMALLDNQPRSASVMAMEDSTLLVLHRADFRRHLERYPDACFAIMQELCHRIRKADAIIGSLALLDVYGRVAHMLLDLAKTDGEQTEDGVVIKDRPTQQNIAAMVGTSRETVSRALSEFQRRGYLEMDGRTIHIYNFAALEEDFMRS